MSELAAMVVYLGPGLPRYVTLNLMYIRERFPNLELIFVCDDVQVARRVSATGTQVHLVDIEEQFLQDFTQLSNLPKEFRQGFWFFTMARFAALASAQTKLNKRVLQFEADTWISDDFPFDRFQEIDEALAFPLETTDKGSASVLFLKDAHASRELYRITKELLFTNPEITDMLVLGELASNGQLPVRILPTLPKVDVHNLNTQLLGESDIDFFGGIFDALPYGMCLLGEDPRNRRGVIRYNHTYQHQLVPTSPYDFKVSTEGNKLWLVDASGEQTPLFNLHIHSKTSRAWRSGNRLYFSMRAARRLVDKSVYHEVVWSSLFRQVIGSIRRRINSALNQ